MTEISESDFSCSIVNRASADQAIENMTAADQDNQSQATMQGDVSSTRCPNYFFLAPKDDFMAHAERLAKRAECLLPYELSTVENACRCYIGWRFNVN